MRRRDLDLEETSNNITDDGVKVMSWMKIVTDHSELLLVV